VEQLQIIQQEMAMRASERGGMAGAFNQLPQEQQQQMMAGGGIVAFNGDEEGNDEYTGQQVRMPVGRGDERVYGQSMAGLQALQTKMAGDRGYSPLTADEEKAMYDRSTSRGKEIYGGLLDKIKADIATQRGEGAESLREGRGLAALQAAAALTQGRGLAQGLGRAGGAFAGAYGQALRSDKEQKRALSAMDLNLAKAESEQLMGLHDKAEAQITKANANREKAHTAGVNRDKAMADILYKSGRLALPPAPTKTGGAPKTNEQLAAAEVAFENDPSEANLKRVTALRRTVDRIRTSDVGPGRAGAEGAKTARQVIDDARKAVDNYRLLYGSAFNKMVKDQYGGDVNAAREALIDLEVERAGGAASLFTASKGNQKPAPAKPTGAPVNNNSPRAGQNDYSNLWN
jgi:hypothetical protein